MKTNTQTINIHNKVCDDMTDPDPVAIWKICFPGFLQTRDSPARKSIRQYWPIRRICTDADNLPPLDVRRLFC